MGRTKRTHATLENRDLRLGQEAHRLIFIRPGDSLSQPSSVQQSYITPRVSDRHSLTFVEHSKVSDILFAILPNQIIVAQISS
jgi:hypothetical protein